MSPNLALISSKLRPIVCEHISQLYSLQGFGRVQQGFRVSGFGSYLGEVEDDPHGGHNGDGNEHHVVLPSNCCKGHGDRPCVRDGVAKETGKGNRGALAAEVRGPDLSPVHVGRALDSGGEEGAEDEVDGHGGVDARSVCRVQIVLGQCAHDADNGSGAEPTSNCSC